MPKDDGQSEARTQSTGDNIAQWTRDLFECLVFLTRLPISGKQFEARSLLSQAMRAFGLAGAIIGLLTAAVLALASWSGLNATLTALLAIAASTALTGALHEDGLADVADGFGGGNTITRKLEIMRDSRIGTFGVLVLVLGVAIRVFALAVIVDAAPLQSTACLVVAVAVSSRCFMGAMMFALPAARPDGRSAEAGQPTREALNQLLASSLILAFPLMWVAAGFWTAVITMLAPVAVSAIFGKLSKNQIGGQTGDVLGATQQLTEITQLLVLAAIYG